MSSSQNDKRDMVQSEGDIIRLVYHSACIIPDYPEVVGLALDDILESARRRNVENGISGALVYADRQFIQILEGPIDSVDETFARIMDDKRHRDVCLVSRMASEQRVFERWPMAFLSEPELRPTLQSVGMNGAFDISRMPVDLIGPFLSRILAPVVEASRVQPLPAGVANMLARAC
jgi:hypothetical protein